MTPRAVEPARLEPVCAHERDASFPSSWRLLDDVAVMDLPDPKFLVQGILPDAAVGALYSPPNVGKTTLAANLLVAVGTGNPWLKQPVLDAGHSIYVGAEDPSGFKVRLRAEKAAAGLSPDIAIGVHTFPEAIDIGDAAQVARFAQFAEERRPRDGQPLKVIVFDTYAASTPGANENSAEDTTMAMVNAIRLRDRFKATVLLCHHTNAGGTRERGHSAMRGAADFMLALTPLDDVLYLECSKMRNAPPFDRIGLRLTAAPDGLPGVVIRHASDVVLPVDHLTANERKAIDALRDSFKREGATRTEWLAACVGMAQSTFYRVTATLADKGLVQTAGSRCRLTPKGVGL